MFEDSVSWIAAGIIFASLTMHVHVMKRDD